MSTIFCVPPLLFVTFREEFGISYTLLGTLVLTNFCTQLAVDLIFTFFSKYFNTKRVVKTMPLLTSLGLMVYALIPTFFSKYAYFGLLIGTVLFSVSAGLSEVLLSPTIAAIPSDNPQRDMSTLHSLYAFGVFTMVVISTLFLKIFGNDNWAYLIIFLALLPIISSVLFAFSPMPNALKSQGIGGLTATRSSLKGIALCAFCIFFGSCAENVMSNWISSYIENALQIDKALGDVLGVAGFAVLLGIARITYAKIGKNIIGILLVGMIGASVCYLVASLIFNTFLSFIACVLTGLFTAMLWPGTLIMMEEKVPGVGVAAYALMASSGDLGAAIAPQLTGLVVDGVSASSFATSLSQKMGVSVEQIGLRAGMLVNCIFPILGAVTVVIAIKYFKKTVQR
ncbi:MAG: MFS transporter [Clostridia bacterium]|nr:MFS transporter [Clostridia bacterium]